MDESGTGYDEGTSLSPRNQFGHNNTVSTALIVARGRLRLTAGQRCISVGPGEGVFVDGDTPYSYVTEGETFYVLADFWSDDPVYAGVLPEPWVLLPTPSLLAATFSVFAHASRSVDTSRAVPSATVSRRDQVLAYIAAHHARPELNVSTLATELGLLPRTLQRLFAGETRGVAEEIMAVRLEHALELLRDPRLVGVPLETIAAQCGFSSAARMRRAIRAATGNSPREYRATCGDFGFPVANDRVVRYPIAV